MSGITEVIKLFPIRNAWIICDPLSLGKGEQGIMVSVTFTMNDTEGEVIGSKFSSNSETGGIECYSAGMSKARKN